jgi:TonB family protein
MKIANIGLVVVLVVGLTATANTVTAQSAPPAVLPEAAADHPWWNCPDPAVKMERYYPKRAQALSKTGSADIQCRISAAGKPEACVWTSESEPGFGFGEAAEKIGCLFKFKKTTGDGNPVGGLFHTTIRFNLK